MDHEQMQMAEELLFSKQKEFGVAKDLFFGTLDPIKLAPFKPSSFKDPLFEKLETFLEEGIDPSEIDKKAEIPSSVIHFLSECGVMGMTVDPEFLGLGMSQTSYCRVTEMIAEKCASTALFVNVHQSIGLRALAIYGTEEQKKRWLPSMAKGLELAAFALTEEQAGSDASNIKTKAIYNPSKKCYVINGKKRWITNGSIASMITLIAKCDVEGEEKITAFLVTPDMKGFHVEEKSLEKLGVRGTKTAILSFKDMEVPKENILGEVGSGLKVALTVLDYGRVTFGALTLGVAKEVLKRSIDRAKTRIQFKKPIGSFPLVKKKIARIASLTYAIDAATYMTASFIDAKKEDFMLEAAILKVFASEALWSIVYEGGQIYGGESYFVKEPFERMLRDARINTIGEGANEVLLAFIALVGMREVGFFLKAGVSSLKEPIRKRKTVRSFLSLLFYHPKPSIPLKNQALSSHRRCLEKAICSFKKSTLSLLRKEREGIVRNQLQQERIAKLLINLYVRISVLLKLDRQGVQPEGLFFLEQAERHFQRVLKGISTNNDKSVEQLSDTLLEL